MAGVQALMQYLRESPPEFNPAQLAERFELSESVVHSVMRQLSRQAIRAPEAPTPKKRSEFAIVAGLKRLWNRLTDRAGPFVVITPILGAVVFSLLSELPKSALGGPVIGRTIMFALFVVYFLGSPTLQVAAAVRKRQVRFVVIGALAFAVSFIIMALWGDAKRETLSSQLAVVFAGAMGMFMLEIMLGAPIVLLASYMAVKREQKAASQRTRQQALERTLQIHQALESADRLERTPATIDHPLVEKFGKNVYWLSFAVGLVYLISYSLILLKLDPNRTFIATGMGDKPPQNPALFTVAMMAVSISVALQFVIGFLTKSIKSAFLASLCYLLGTAVAYTIPIGYFNYSTMGAVGYLRMISGFFFAVIAIGGGSLGRQITLYGLEMARRKENDPDALVAELIELEKVLGSESAVVAVMVVDVVGSTKLKDGLDPLVVEWSFRAYQEFVAAVCAEFGGAVHATAGDGTILGFAEAQNALSAARRLLVELGAFNANVNRTGRPFAIRIGLHLGESQGALKDVQFTRVIDVAAHIEAGAPVGGIAASGTFVAELAVNDLEASDAVIDGQAIFLQRPVAYET